MLGLEDERWTALAGGYRLKFDPRPLLRKLEASPESTEAWDELIENLYHQGDVGEASYAAVPYLAEIESRDDLLPWRLLALVSFIELARLAGHNPALPDWLESDYHNAIRLLAQRSLKAITQTDNAEQLRGMLCVIALWKGLRVYASIINDYSEDELETLLPAALDKW